MSIVIPAIIPQSALDLEDKLARLAEVPAVTAVQIDAIDGRFATPACWPYSALAALASLQRAGWTLPHQGRFVYDADLMTDDPERAVDLWSSLGASRLTIHAESAHALPHVLATIHARHGHTTGFAPELFSLGLAISATTDLALLVPYLPQVEYVQLMGIRTIGKQGEPFDKRVIEKVRALRRLNAHITIQVDGGVTLETAPALLAAGANRLIVGHDIWLSHSIAREIAKFDALANPYAA